MYFCCTVFSSFNLFLDGIFNHPNVAAIILVDCAAMHRKTNSNPRSEDLIWYSKHDEKKTSVWKFFSFLLHK